MCSASLQQQVKPSQAKSLLRSHFCQWTSSVLQLTEAVVRRPLRAVLPPDDGNPALPADCADASGAAAEPSTWFCVRDPRPC